MCNGLDLENLGSSDQDSIVDIDPQTVCGYNPCMVAKCILLPYATCVSDFKCRPVFFDSEERKVSQCTGGVSVFMFLLLFFCQAKKPYATDWASWALLLQSILDGFMKYLQSVISWNRLKNWPVCKRIVTPVLYQGIRKDLPNLVR